jgi:hypothetical protein
MDIKCTGIIENIERKKGGLGFEKYLVTVVQRRKKPCFIEFRGLKVMKALEGLKIGNCVEVTAWIEGSISKGSGLPYNNIIAKKITELQPHATD